MPSPAEQHRMYFLALLCPPEINQDVLRFKHWMRDHFGCRVALKSPAHITLVAPFWWQEDEENRLTEHLHLFETDTPSLSITLDGFDHFNGRVLFIRVTEHPALASLKQEVERHFHLRWPEQIKTDQRKFHPHVTIANRDLGPSAFAAAWTHFSGKDYRKIFGVSQLHLLKLNNGKWEPWEGHQWTPDKN